MLFWGVRLDIIMSGPGVVRKMTIMLNRAVFGDFFRLFGLAPAERLTAGQLKITGTNKSASVMFTPPFPRWNGITVSPQTALMFYGYQLEGG